MAGNVGRSTTFYWGGDSPADEILGVREKAISMNGEPIDVTADDSAGWREVITDTAAENQVSISLTGVVKDRRMITDWYAGRRTQPARIVFDGGDSITGTFFLQSLSETGPYNDASTFQAEIISSGVVTYTAVV
jgi:predicted secreted protein